MQEGNGAGPGKPLDGAATSRSEGLAVAVVGAGPSGIYAVLALLEAESVKRVDVFESLPAPYGLLRYGVAPDHPKTKRVARALGRAFDDPRVRFLGNVHIGRDLAREDLLERYDAIVYATGARYDRELGIPGEDLTGSLGAANFVAWYSGHSDVPRPVDWEGTRRLAVIGAGNVALDVSRISLQPDRILARTDMPREVVAELQRGAMQEVHLLIRRGPEHVKFSRVELAELLALPDTRIVLHVDPARLTHGADLPREAATNLRLLREAYENPRSGTKEMHFHFWTVPIAIEGEDRVTGVRLRSSPPGGPVIEAELPASAVIRAIGYRGEPIPGLPFDRERRLIPNVAGAVAGKEREYVTGWVKRGPTGVIGTNKHDAHETVATLLAAAEHAPAGERRDRVGDRLEVTDLLKARGVTWVDWPAWQRIEAAEEQLGAKHGAPTVKIADRGQILDAAHPKPGPV